MSRFPRYLLVALVATLALMLILPLVALAHESRDVVSGKYRFVVGWAAEPAYVGQKNGIDLTVTSVATNQPVEGLEKTLKAEIMQGGQKREVALKAVFRQPGKYTSDVVPTKEGDYRFRFLGSIEGANIDEMFDSANGKFNGVQNFQAIQFPTSDVSTTQLNEAVAAAEAKAAAAQSAVATSQLFGIAGLVLGLAGLVLGGLAFMNSRKSQAVGVPSPRTTGR